MRTFGLILFALLLHPVVVAAQDSRAVSTHLTLPSRVGDFRLVSSRQMEGGGGGQLHYRSAAGMEVDAFVSPVPVIPDCLHACDSVAVDVEADSFPALIPAMVRRGEFDSLTVERDAAIVMGSPTGALIHGRHLWLTGAAGGKPVRSHLLLYGTGSYLIRVRSTFAPSAKRDSLTTAFGQDFVVAASQPSSGARTCPNGAADQQAMRVSVDSRSPIAELRARVEPALAGLGLTPDPKASRPDSTMTLPVAGWPSGIDYGPWAREAGPGFVVGVLLQERAGGTRVTVSAQAICSPRFGQEDPKSLEIALEMATAGEVLRKLEPPRPRR
ncbi:MAG: hypothetical protein JO040_09275 [Gemmatimonadetes bacterium]|nr:hypothetical protein [Gemmatimonadota bacterium]